MLNVQKKFQRAHGNINVKINNNEVNRFYQSGSAKVFYPKSPQEIKEFFEGLSQESFTKIKNFFDTMPRVRHEIEVTNPVTKVKSKVTLQGLNDFFESASPIIA